MQRIPAKELIVTQDVEDDPQCLARAARLMSRIDADEIVRNADDASLCRIIKADGLDKDCARHGVTEKIESTVIFVKGRFEATDEEKAKRKKEFPVPFANGAYRFH